MLDFAILYCLIALVIYSQTDSCFAETNVYLIHKWSKYHKLPSATVNFHPNNLFNEPVINAFTNGKEQKRCKRSNITYPYRCHSDNYQELTKLLFGSSFPINLSSHKRTYIHRFCYFKFYFPVSSSIRPLKVQCIPNEFRINRCYKGLMIVFLQLYTNLVFYLFIHLNHFPNHSSTKWDIEEHADFSALMGQARCKFPYTPLVYGNIPDTELACYYDVIISFLTFCSYEK